MRKILMFALIAIAIASCAPSSSEEESVTTSTESKAPAKEQEKEAKPQGSIEQELFELIQGWLKTQNKGDFKSYSSYYGDSFSGIKRAGSKTSTYNRETWLKDRSRMFNKPMRVNAQSVKINYKTEPYKVTFNQTWQSNTYRDYGPKVMLISRVEGKLVIINEEMLQSQILVADETMSDALDHPLFFHRSGDHVLFDIKATATDLIDKGMRCQDGPEDDVELCVETERYGVDVSQLSTDFQAMVGQPVHFGMLGNASIESGVFTGFEIIGEQLTQELPGLQIESGMFDFSYEWVGETMNPNESRTVGLTTLTGAQDPDVGQWAFVSDKAPLYYTESSASDALRLKFYKEFSVETSSYNPEPVSLQVFSDGTREFLVSSLLIEECGEEYFADVVIWKLDGDNYEKLQDLPDYPLQILDLDHDGGMDFLFEGSLDKDPNRFIQWTYPYFRLENGDTLFNGCGC